MDAKRQRLEFSYVAMLFTTALWAFSGIFVHFIIAGSAVVAPALAFWRDLFAFTVLVATLGLLRPQWLRVQRRDVKWLVLLGGSLGLLHVLWNVTVMLNGVAAATVQQSVSPVIVTLVARVAMREPLTRRKVTAIILAFAGTLLVAGLDVLGQARLSATGLLSGLLMSVFHANFALFSKQVARAYHPLAVLTYGFGFGALVLLPLQFLVPQPSPGPLTSWVYFAGLVLLATILPFATYVWALGSLQASVASILAMAEIPMAYVYAYLWLGERLTGPQVVGALMTVAGVLLLSSGEWRQGGDVAR